MNVKCLIIWPLEETNNSERTLAYDAFSTFNYGWHHANIKLRGRTSDRFDLTSDHIFLKHWQCQENRKNWSLPYDKLWLSLLSRYRWRTENGKHRTYRRRRRNDNCVLQLPLPGSLISNLLFLWFLIFLGPTWSYTIYKGGAGRWFLWRSSQTETSLHFCRTLRCCQVRFVWTLWLSSQICTLLAHFKHLFVNYIRALL